MKVLVLDQNPDDACSWYRCSGPWSKVRGVDVIFNQAPSWAEIRSADVLFVLRPHNERDVKAIKLAKLHGTKVWIDYDDNLFELPPENPSKLIFSRPQNQMAMMKSLELADLITVSTEPLKQTLSKYAKKEIAVIPNALDDIFLQPKSVRPNKKHKVVLWRGTSTHLYDLESYREAILSVAAKFPQVLWLFMGTEPWFSGQLNSRIMGPQTLFEYFNMLSSLSVDVGIVPLRNDSFNRSKSNIAAMELSFAGGACLVPDWETWQFPGAVNYKDQDDFAAKLELILKLSDTSELAKKSFDFFKTSYSLGKMNLIRTRELLMGRLAC